MPALLSKGELGPIVLNGSIFHFKSLKSAPPLFFGFGLFRVFLCGVGDGPEMSYQSSRSLIWFFLFNALIGPAVVRCWVLRGCGEVAVSTHADDVALFFCFRSDKAIETHQSNPVPVLQV